MPMYIGYIELEMDNVDSGKYPAGRLPQEMAKSRHDQGNVHPNGMPRELIDYKMRKTEQAVGARITQVLRRERET